jgi:hypothetical protein
MIRQKLLLPCALMIIGLFIDSDQAQACDKTMKAGTGKALRRDPQKREEFIVIIWADAFVSLFGSGSTGRRPPPTAEQVEAIKREYNQMLNETKEEENKRRLEELRCLKLEP